MSTTDEAAAGGIFQRLGDVVVRWPLLVIGFWIALAATLSLALPPLAVVAARQQTALLPNDAPVLVASQQMSKAFHETGMDNLVLVLLTDEKGLGPADEQTYGTLVEKLHQDTPDVKTLQDFVSAPPLREILESKDKKAWNLPIVLNGNFGAPESRSEYKHVADVVKHAVAGSTLTAHLTGPAATVADIAETSERDLHLIEAGTTIIVLLILLIVYRNPITMMLPLITIGISLATAQGALAGFAELGLGMTAETIVLMTVVMVGAGVDYAVFLISRYHDYVRLGADSDQAVKEALTSVGKVIVASAATVAVTFLAMIFARLPVFTAVGPAISISIAVAFLAAVTLLPAILALAGRRGWIKPRRNLTNRFWRRSGIRIVRRPKTHLVGSLIALIALASCVSLVHYNYDDRKTLPGAAESTVGAAAMERHFPPDSISAQFLLVQSPHDLRTPQALADLEQMAGRVSQVSNIALVRGITRPTGEPLEQAKATYQAGEVGGKLGDASDQIKNHNDDLNLLTGGENQLADALGGMRSQLTEAMGTAGVLVGALSAMQSQLGGGTTLNSVDNATQLVGSMHALGETIGVDFAHVSDSFRWADPLLTALNASPICDADPSCLESRAQLERLVATRHDGTLQKVADLSRQLQSAQGEQSLDSTVKGLRRSLDTATTALQSMGGNGLQGRLSTLQQGSDALADGSRRLADGVQLLVDQTRQMGAGLGDASAFLMAMKHDAGKPSMAGFYIPPQILTQDEFKKAAGVFVSPEGHAVRYIVQTKLDPFTTTAMDQVDSITEAASSALPNTSLADAKVSMAGVSVALRDTRDYYNHDIKFFVMSTIIIVLLILIVLLRAIVAPLYLIGSVILSYMSALGLGVVVFQFILRQELHWSLPGLTFILLVAMGADYNLLLISRIREESPHGIRLGVIRTVGSTGGVITSAGLIFAASMFGLLCASINTLVQAGFVIGVGILIDTFLVRTITVPALAVIIGRANWWPYRWWPRRYSPARWAKKGFKRRQLISGVATHDEQTRINLPATLTDQHRGRRPRRWHLLPRWVPLFGRHSSPKQTATVVSERQALPMKFALASCGTRGDIEPCAAVGLELIRRGHDVRMAAPPSLVGFVESAGLAAVPYGPDSQVELVPDFFRDFCKFQNPIRPVREAIEQASQVWSEMSRALTSLADGADVLLTGMIYQELAANVAEYYDIPLAALHYFPVRVNGHVIPIVPSPLIRSTMSAIWWLQWRMTKAAEDAQRRELGLPTATGPASRRMEQRGTLEIQAYDQLCFPGLAAEWAESDSRRPFVGALTMALPTHADDEVASWIAAGTPPIYFGFGSMPVRSPAATVATISAACLQLGERALICSGTNDFSHIPHSDHVKIVAAVDHAAIFPACRAVVHHGGAGTTAAGLRAGVPTLILWVASDQPIWAARVKRLKVGSGRRFSATTQDTLVADLRRILAPDYVTRAREFALGMTQPADSVTAAADLLQDAGHRKTEHSSVATP